MFEYIFTIGCFDKFHKGHIALLKTMKDQSEKIIIGLHCNDSSTKLKNITITNIDSYETRKKNLEMYADDIFMINEIDPTKSLQEYISTHFNHNLLPINIGSSKTNNKVIHTDYKSELFFMHDYKDTFTYHYTDNKLIITRTDQNSGWGQNLLGYKKNWCFMTTNDNKNFTSINYVKSIMPIKYLSYSNEMSVKKMNTDIKNIDMVFTYVDGYDPEFINLKNKYIDDESIKYYPDIRNKGIDEIIFSVNSVIKYIPWIRTIFIVTSHNQIPPIHKELIQSGKVVIVDDKTIIEHKYLPTFNSDTIESYLHNIPGLSEIFLYNNDDMMHFDFVHRSDIYNIENNKIVIKIINNDMYTKYHNIVLNCLSKDKYIKHNKLFSTLSKNFAVVNEYNLRINNTIDFLLEINVNKNLRFVNNHHTKILRKSTLKLIEENYSNKLTELRNHRFRGDNYIQYLFFVINIDNILNDNLIINNSPYLYEGFFDDTNYKEGVFDDLLKIRPKFVCLNSMNYTYKNEFFKLMNKIV